MGLTKAGTAPIYLKKQFAAALYARQEKIV
jgi:hypothetical protein